MLGVQWHAESLDRDAALFRALVAASQAHADLAVA